jgi:SAM-dependent methyltransferase
MTDENFDVYEGLSWSERARFGVYGVALDCADTIGRKNSFIDWVHKLALAQALRGLSRRFERALDFGCGGARLLPLLSSFAKETYGVDRTPDCIEMARAAKVVPDEHLVLWRDGPLPFADGYFDLFLSAYVLLRTAVLDAAIPELARVTAAGGNGILIEQLDNERGLTLERYHGVFKREGFRVVREHPIRRSSGSRWLRIASSPRCPAFVNKLAARGEISSAAGARFDAGTKGYFDCLFVLQRTS